MAQAAIREKWKTLVRRRAESGLSVREFCRRERVSTASFYAWKRRLYDEQAEGEPSLFTPVTVIGQPPAAIEIRFPRGAVMTLPASDERALRTVTAVLLGDRP